MRPSLRHDRRGLRYTHDLTEEEWAEIEALIPPAKPGGNKRTVNIREVVNGLMYILGSGCQWRDIPKDLPPRSTICVSACKFGSDSMLMHFGLTVDSTPIGNRCHGQGYLARSLWTDNRTYRTCA
jgi:hypothetical protein